MKVKHFFMASTAVLTLFSCSNESSSDAADQGISSLAIAINSPAIQPKAIDTPQADKTTIHSLVVRVFDGNNAQLGTDISITGQTLTDVVAPTSSIPLNDPKRIIEQIGQTATNIEARGYNKSTAPAWIEKSVFDASSITTLQLATLPFEEIPFISITENGKNNITKTDQTGSEPGHAGHKVWTAQAEIKPYFARFEVSGTPQEKNSAAAIELKAIYLNNIALEKGAEKTIFKGNGGIWQTTNGVITGTSGDMENGYKEAFINMYNETLANYGTDKVDAYTLWGQTGMLHLILKVKVTPNGEQGYEGFITLKNITGSTDIEIGKIYKLKLNELEIEYEKDVDPQPYDEGADLYLGLTVHPWDAVTLYPGL